MKNTTKIALLIAGGVAVLGLALFLLFLPGDRGRAAAQAENFAKEFATFDESDPADYRDRTEKFLAPAYKNEFFDKYGIVNAGEKDYQRITKASSGTLVSFTRERAVVDVAMEGVKSDPPVRPEEFKVDIKVQVTLEKIGGDWKVSFVGFAP